MDAPCACTRCRQLVKARGDLALVARKFSKLLSLTTAQRAQLQRLRGDVEYLKRQPCLAPAATP